LLEPGAQAAADAPEQGERRPGLGLGLATAQRLVQLLGGTLNARGTPGQGSDFWCELPLPSVDAGTAMPSQVLPGNSNARQENGAGNSAAGRKGMQAR
jgi:hypothetical protein